MIFVYFFLLTSVHCDLSSLNSVKELAGAIGSVVEDSFVKYSGYNILQNSYTRRADDMRLDTVDVQSYLDQVSDAMTSLFTERVKSLEALVSAAESGSRSFTPADKLQLNSVLAATDSVLASQLSQQRQQEEEQQEGEEEQAGVSQLAFDSVWARPVNWSLAALHTPLEVYEGYSQVLNAIMWSHSVDSAARANRRRDPHLLWQYVASRRGLLRYYPATWWPAPTPLTGDVDLYDARRRPWYLTAATSRRDLLIIMDISGSVYGQTFEIMKVAVRSALNTLTSGDYFNVIWSTNKAGWVDRCMRGLVPASLANKRRVSAAIDHLTAVNISDWSTALDMAYSAFQQFYDTEPLYAGARCNKMIVFLTDGGTEWPGDVISAHANNTHTQHVRLFTYALGPHPVPAHLLSKMACENGGTFNAIFSSGAVRTVVQSFQTVLAEPLADVASLAPSFTTPYLDAGGLGMVITVSKPIFNRSEAAVDGRLLGVAGVDVALHELHRIAETLLPSRRALAPFGYLFAVNNHGVVMFHPRLKPPLDASQDAADADIVVLEGDDDDVHQLRAQLVDGTAGSQLRQLQLVWHNGAYLTVPDVRYTYRPILGTPISVGVALPVGHTRLTVLTSSLGDSSLLTEPGTALAPSVHCCLNYSDHDTATNKCCDSSMYRHLLWDLQWTEEVVQSWLEYQPLDDVVARFVSTESGLVRYNSNSTTLDMSELSVDSLLYRRTALSDTLIVHSLDESHLVVARRITVDRSPAAFHTLAVSGVVYKSDWLSTAVTADVSPSAPLYRRLCTETGDQQQQCWLVDREARVATSGGQFLGHSEPLLMQHLVNTSIFTRHVHRDNMGVCGKRSRRPALSAAPCRLHLLHAPLALLHSLSGWLTQLLYLVSSVLVSWQTGLASGLDEFGFELNSGRRPCSRIASRYLLTDTAMPDHQAQVTVTCDDLSLCQRNYQMVLIPRTNLAMLLAEPGCNCVSHLAPMTTKTVEVDETSAILCSDEPAPLYRRRVEQCFARSSNTSVCSGSGGGLNVPSAIVATVAAALVSRLSALGHRHAL